MLFSLAATVLAASSLGRVSAGIPPKIHGVNIGSWLLLEPWMLPNGMSSILDAVSCLFTLLCRMGPNGR